MSVTPELWLLVMGTPGSGFQVIGYFDDDDEADNWGVGNDDFWAMEPDMTSYPGATRDGTHVVVVGSFGGGFSLIGPFPDEDTATAVAEQIEGDWHVVEVEGLHRNG